MTQTLEPRLFYVKTPFRDQSRFPVFDTGLADLNFAQLFSENRYAGHDRIGDANQLTAALVTRYIEPSGAERMRLAIGQRFSFSDQRVTLGGETTESRSDLLLAATGKLLPSLTVDGNLQYSQTLRQSTRSSYALRWEPAPKKLLNLQYRFDRKDPINPLNELKQVDVSGQWPIAQRWYGVGRINYSLPDKQSCRKLAGSRIQGRLLDFPGRRAAHSDRDPDRHLGIFYPAGIEWFVQNRIESAGSHSRQRPRLSDDQPVTDLPIPFTCHLSIP